MTVLTYSHGASSIGTAAASATTDMAARPYLSASTSLTHRVLRAAPTASSISSQTVEPTAPVFVPILLLTEHLAAPLPVRLTREDGLVFLIDPATGIFGSGESVNEAVRDLAEALRGHLEVLQIQSRLSKELQRQLHMLRAYFVDEDN
jgi:predicted RNase H-like HicB family nuclease